MAVDKPQQGQDRRLGEDLGQSTGGSDMVLTGVLFALFGLWLDSKLGTTPLFIILLTVIGFAGSVINVYYRYNREIERLDAETAALRSRATTSNDNSPQDSGR